MTRPAATVVAGRAPRSTSVAKGQGYGGTSDIVADLRVDDHPDPCAELARLLDLHVLYFDKPDPATALPLDGELADEVRATLSSLGHHGEMSPDGLDAALASWAGVANLEERMVPGAIDPLVLAPVTHRGRRRIDAQRPPPRRRGRRC